MSRDPSVEQSPTTLTSLSGYVCRSALAMLCGRTRA
jgi:hypothetical protein